MQKIAIELCWCIVYVTELDFKVDQFLQLQHRRRHNVVTQRHIS